MFILQHRQVDKRHYINDTNMCHILQATTWKAEIQETIQMDLREHITFIE